MQKTYTPDFLTKKMVENNGEVEQYYVQGNHEAIISPDDWEAVQHELERREGFMESHGIKEISSKAGTAFFSKVYCGKCGSSLLRRNVKGQKPFWRCKNAEKANGHTCDAENVKEEDLRQAFTITWNSLVENRENELPRWQKMVESEDVLERLRGKQMIELTAEGRLKFEITELTRMVLDEVTVTGPKSFTVKLLDGTVKRIKL